MKFLARLDTNINFHLLKLKCKIMVNSAPKPKLNPHLSAVHLFTKRERHVQTSPFLNFTRFRHFTTARVVHEYKIPTDKDIEYFESEDIPLLTSPSDCAAFNTDWMRKYKGTCRLVLKPKNVHQVSLICKYANDNGLKITTQGGNTGLVGGGVPINNEIILSTINLNQVKNFDPVAGILTAQAGCILQNLDAYLSQHGFIMPLDLGAKGGNVATNAGGIRLLRYGSLRGTVLSLEVVLADGTIMELGKPLRKDNTGYDLKQLFIGSEGTLGVITAVSILTPPLPLSTSVAILGLESYDKAIKAFQMAKRHLGEILSAFEFFDRPSLELTLKHLTETRDPFETQVPFYVLIETHGSNKDHDDAKLDFFLQTLLEQEIVCDGVLAQDLTQASKFWEIREEACSKEGGMFKYDLSVPVANLYDVVLQMRERLRQNGLYHPEDVKARDGDVVYHVVGFGHVGDGNLHMNIMTSGFTPALTAAIEPFVYELTQSFDGSISAEHGLGQMKAPYLGYSQTLPVINLMKTIKQTFDPKNTLNPEKYFPEGDLKNVETAATSASITSNK